VLFLGNVPIGSGLSSSAALEISTALAVAKLWNVDLDPLEAARIGQKAEHDFAGAKCGLLDQISSLYGTEKRLVMTDFRSLKVKNPPFSGDYVFLACNTHAKHALVDGAYNERRASCEAAAAFFAAELTHPVSALRDVSMDEWKKHSGTMNAVHAKRAAHVIGENERVLKGMAALDRGDFEEFGELMYESHESSINNFENSCWELDFIVETTRRIPGVLGARLSGGGFGGSVIVLLNARDVETVSKAVSSAYAKEFSQKCDVQLLKPSAGAKVLIP
jgi:galactokinase